MITATLPMASQKRDRVYLSPGFRLGLSMYLPYLAPRQKKSANAVCIARRCLEGLGFRAGLLDAAQPSVGIHMMQHPGPCLFDHRAVDFPVQPSFIYSCGERKGKESRARDFRQVVIAGIEQAGSPQPIGRLNLCHTCSNFLELRDVLCTGRVILGQILGGCPGNS